MFLGDHQHTLDAKGRVSLPAKFRAQMTGRIVVAKGLDDCLYVYPADEYRAFVDGSARGLDFDPRKRQLRRFFTTGAFETELDSAGRVSLPANLREYAGLEQRRRGHRQRQPHRDLGRGGWSAYSGASTEKIEDLAQELADAGLL